MQKSDFKPSYNYIMNHFLIALVIKSIFWTPGHVLGILNTNEPRHSNVHLIHILVSCFLSVWQWISTKDRLHPFNSRNVMKVTSRLSYIALQYSMFRKIIFELNLMWNSAWWFKLYMFSTPDLIWNKRLFAFKWNINA